MHDMTIRTDMVCSQQQLCGEMSTIVTVYVHVTIHVMYTFDYNTT